MRLPASRYQPIKFGLTLKAYEQALPKGRAALLAAMNDSSAKELIMDWIDVGDSFIERELEKGNKVSNLLAHIEAAAARLWGNQNRQDKPYEISNDQYSAATSLVRAAKQKAGLDMRSAAIEIGKAVAAHKREKNPFVWFMMN